MSNTANTNNPTEASMGKFNATIEFIRRGAAIVTLCDQTGQWSGGGLVQAKNGSKSDLYEQGYIVASLSAKSKGGRLETFKVTEVER